MYDATVRWDAMIGVDRNATVVQELAQRVPGYRYPRLTLTQAMTPSGVH